MSAATPATTPATTPDTTPDTELADAAASGPHRVALAPGTRVDDFEIVRVLGAGGFGIVYLATDLGLGREVALKEYRPAFAGEAAGGRRAFVDEARLLARFDHPSLVPVYRLWEDGEAAWMVMPQVRGLSLHETRCRLAAPPGEAWVRSVVLPVLAALELLHEAGVCHRDVAPDNIVLPTQGPPVLLDFGAAHDAGADAARAALVKPGYTPIEQYAEMAHLPQGPWTDLYALGAVMHFLLLGVPPAPAPARATSAQAQVLPAGLGAGTSPGFLAALAWMLAVQPEERPQSAAQVRALMG